MIPNTLCAPIIRPLPFAVAQCNYDDSGCGFHSMPIDEDGSCYKRVVAIFRIYPKGQNPPSFKKQITK